MWENRRGKTSDTGAGGKLRFALETIQTSRHRLWAWATSLLLPLFLTKSSTVPHYDCFWPKVQQFHTTTVSDQKFNSLTLRLFLTKSSTVPHYACFWQQFLTDRDLCLFLLCSCLGKMYGRFGFLFFVPAETVELLAWLFVTMIKFSWPWENFSSLCDSLVTAPNVKYRNVSQHSLVKNLCLQNKIK